MVKQLGAKLCTLALLVGLLLPGSRPEPLQAAPTTYTCATATGLPRVECEALVAIFYATDGHNWGNDFEWLRTTTPCTWYGVTCEAGRVTCLTLPSNGLRGPLPPQIGNLTALKSLDLYGNHLTVLPPQIGALTALTTLDLWSNALTALPPEIGDLTALTHLDLWSNTLTALPPEIGALTALTYLDLSNNALTALPPQIGNLTTLKSLDLYGNHLTALPPGIGNIKLVWLDVAGNTLTALPPGIGNFSALGGLRLDQNALTALPPEIGNLSALRELVLNYNALTVLPPEIGNLSALTILSLGDNALTTLPPEIGNLSALEFLYLTGNALTTLPPEIGNLSALISLSLENNALTALPPEIGNLTKLVWLDVAGNTLTALPPGIGNFSALGELRLDHNALTALPPEFGNLTALGRFTLDHNPLSGEMPAFLTSLTSLDYFSFYATGWCVPTTGAVPTWLAGVRDIYSTGLICGQAPGRLSGRVTLPGAISAAGEQVNLYRSLGWWVRQDTVTTTYTLADGTYQFDCLGQGINYQVQFTDPTGHYVSEYYDNQPDVGLATPVTVTLGMTRTGIDAELAPVAPQIIKSATPALTVTNGGLLIYTLVIYTGADTLHLYDPLDPHLTWQGFVGAAPGTLTYTNGALTGTMMSAALTPLTVSFAMRVSLPAESFVGEYAQVSNTAYAYIGETLILSHPSNTVTRTVHELPFALFLPLVIRQ